MFNENNPEIDFAGLAERTRHRAATGRRAEVVPLAAPAAEPVAPAPTWRDHVRGWPVLGPLLAYTYRGLRHAAQPGLGLRARLRALPFVGGAAAWLSAVATLPRWRRHLHHQDDQLRRDMAALRAAQTDLMRDLVATRAAVRALQARLDAAASSKPRA